MDYTKLLSEQGRMHLALSSDEGARLVDAVGDTLECWSGLRDELERMTMQVERGAEDAKNSLNNIESSLDVMVKVWLDQLEEGLTKATLSGVDAAAKVRSIRDLLKKTDTKNEAAIEDVLNDIRGMK